MLKYDVLTAAVALMRPACKRWGFTSRGRLTFLRGAREGGAVGIILIQKDSASDAAAVKVAVNYGVYSRRLGAALDDEPKVATDIWSAHWRARVRRDGQEAWFVFAADGEPALIASVLTSAIDELMPDLVAHMTDEDLRDAWLAGHAGGLGEWQRLLFLAVMLQLIGPLELLPPVLAELDSAISGQPHEANVRYRLARAMAHT